MSKSLIIINLEKAVLGMRERLKSHMRKLTERSHELHEQKKTNKDLQQQLSDLTLRYHLMPSREILYPQFLNLRTENEELKNLVKKLQAEIDEWDQRDAERSDAMLDSFETNRANLDHEKKISRCRLDLVHEREAELKERTLQHLQEKTRVDDKIKEIELLRAELKRKDDQLLSASTRIGNLLDNSDRQQICCLEEVIRGKTIEIDRLVEGTKSQGDRLADQAKSIATLQIDCHENKAAALYSATLLERRDIDFRALKSENEQLRLSKCLAQDLEFSKMKITSLEKNLESLQGRYKVTNDKLNDFDKQNRDLEQELNRIRKESNNIRSSFENQRTELQQQNTRILQLQNQIEDDPLIADLNRKIHFLEEAVQCAERANKRLVESRDAVSSEAYKISNLEAEILDGKRLAANIDGERHNLEVELNRLKKTAEKTDAINNELTAKTERQKAELAKMIESRNALRESVEQSKCRISSLLGEKRAAESRVSEIIADRSAIVKNRDECLSRASKEREVLLRKRDDADKMRDESDVKRKKLIVSVCAHLLMFGTSGLALAKALEESKS